MEIYLGIIQWIRDEQNKLETDINTHKIPTQSAQSSDF